MLSGQTHRHADRNTSQRYRGRSSSCLSARQDYAAAHHACNTVKLL